MKNIAIVTENFYHPWSPNDLESFLGGSQECVVLLAEALLNTGFYQVDVFTYGPIQSNTEERNGVIYRDFSNFNYNYDSIILFKVNPLQNREELKNINVIYWSSDVEERPKCDYINSYVCLTEYHKERCGWSDAIVIPHGIDTESLMRNRVNREKNTIIYSSSLDRGLDILLANWKKIKEKYPEMKLLVTYGFKISNQLSSYGSLLNGKVEDNLKQICTNLDIEYLGDISKDELEKLYWRCEYWCLPLKNPDSELFCFNAVKSQFCGCTPIVYQKGALLETVKDHIHFDSFVDGNKEQTIGKNDVPTYTWEQVVQKYWIALLN